MSRYDDLIKTAMLLCMLVLEVIVIGELQMVFKIPITFPGWLLVMLIFFTIKKIDKSYTMGFIVTFICIVIIGMFLSSITLDFSWDGQWYHQYAALWISEGWNIYYDDVTIDRSYNNPELWSSVYPKAAEIYAASMYNVFGNLMSGKSYQIFLIIAGLILTYKALDKFATLSGMEKKILSVLLVFNPVVITQINTFYVDGALYLVFYNFIVATVLWIEDCKKDYLYIIFANLCLGINFKFTGLVYLIIISLSVVLYLKASKNIACLITYLKIIIMAFSVGVFIVGYNPYVTNMLRYDHPFYPLAGANKIDIISNFEHPSFLKKNRFEKLAIATFSNGRNEVGFTERAEADKKGQPKFKIPGTTSIEELKLYSIPDARIGGFGPFFSLIFILSMFSFFMIIKNIRRIPLALKFIFAGVLMAVFINPECWWARYVPFYYSLLLGIIIVALKYNMHSSFYKKLVITVLIINITLVSLVSIITQLKVQYECNNQLEVLKKIQEDSNFELYVDYGMDKSILATRFKSKNINYNLTKDDLSDKAFSVIRLEKSLDPPAVVYVVPKGE